MTIADHIAAQNLCNGVLAALFSRERTGVGQRVEVSLLAGQIFAQAREYTAFFMTGKVPGRANGGHPLLRGIYGVFPTDDGTIAIVGAAGPQRTRFFEAIERPDLDDHQRFGTDWYDDDARSRLFEILRGVFRSRPTSHWTERLRAHEVRYAVVRDYADVI